MMTLDWVQFWVTVCAILVSLCGLPPSVKKLCHAWRTRCLRRLWGFKDGDVVVVVCSELDDPEARQHVEPREFIYSLKYGDIDAYFETIITLLRLYPSIRLRSMSAGEAETTRLDVTRHLVVIGGPDYNTLARRVLNWGRTQFYYRSPHVETQSADYPNEIVIFDQVRQKEYCYLDDSHDIGYFERIVNLHNPDSYVVLIGGCHTIGVTGAVKAFSVAESEDGKIPRGVLRNARTVAEQIGKARAFSVLVHIERLGQTISVPLVKESDITVRRD